MSSLELDFRTMPKWMPEALAIQALIDTWARSYGVPREAILRQIPIAYAWAQSNKNKAPKKNIIRYLFNFIQRAHKYHNLTVEPRGNPYKEPKPEGEIMSGDDFARMRGEIKMKKNAGSDS